MFHSSGASSFLLICFSVQKFTELNNINFFKKVKFWNNAFFLLARKQFLDNVRNIFNTKIGEIN